MAGPELSSRQREVLQLVADGFHDAEIAERLGCSTGSVKQHKKVIYDKLWARSAAEAVRIGLQRGEIT